MQEILSKKMGRISFFNLNLFIRIVEKLILHLFLFYGNGQLKQFY
ncbi:hypothetical protein LEP1GSC034_0949 [Leptospira interrogans str. 2003000735]|uniref:Uncharacterized protein n=3 Tax=Leptospira interrogans TaxID=173 RepID=A0A829D4G2_LEPIR|nr:hypothetical protein G436_3345 [Leptospira interrogans serovar Hardjo str. Norma]EKN86866.1 hypothetical protein LEP1GSC027_2535 [Leptospira interrogans str. 2002000624]EKO96667.1 hypothetical protein LEP1GSC057_4339 [Leptospira interrogans str. Brem 329]EKQ37034.1 hypothetical protein LEP1GSC025_1452 [Leptospira interrogans str. 2002000621]EKQ46465.1 hypothetical protein LEP1GSC026_1064 [Leptospira interrogans str. 2002000623]EMJ68878.1 hypothetical protein LEP1GSC034_0949 [Leptospira inte